MALGLLHGTTELLPVSSSGHVALLPGLLGWRLAELDGGLRKSFEVALHAGSALALAGPVGRELASLPRRERALLGLTLAPPVLAGLAFERHVEARLGGVRSVALAQVGAGLALWLADRRAAALSRPNALARAGAVDPCAALARAGAVEPPAALAGSDALTHLAVGAGQAAALVPGVSRAGAALTAARLRALDRPAAVRLARRAALPVTLAASSLKALRLARAGLPGELRGPFAAGAAAAFASTRAARAPASRLGETGSFAPLAAYRVALGLAALARCCA